MAIDSTDRVTSRRAILTAALGGAAAIGVQALATAPGVRAVDVPALLNVSNAATARTTISAGLATDATLAVANTDAGYGARITADPTNGAGTGAWVAVGDATNAWDLTTSQLTTAETGVYGYSDTSALNAAGVWGDSIQGTGGVGTGDYGVLGASAGAAGVYAQGIAPARALVVDGSAHFTMSGRISVYKTKTSASKAVTGVTSASLVFAVLATARTGVYVRAAVASAGKVTVYLNKAPGLSTNVNFVVLD